MPGPSADVVELDLTEPIWDRFFTVAPLVIVGTREPDGGYDLAAKHMAMPLGWDNFYGFVCTERHATYRNAKREGAFTVSFPRPDQIVLTSLSAAPRCEDDSKPALAALPTVPATVIDGVLLAHAYLWLECELDRIIDGFGVNCLIAGRIVAAHIDRHVLRGLDKDDQDIIARAPLLTYLAPGRYIAVDHSLSFPFHAGFKR